MRNSKELGIVEADSMTKDSYPWVTLYVEAGIQRMLRAWSTNNMPYSEYQETEILSISDQNKKLQKNYVFKIWTVAFYTVRKNPGINTI